MTGAMSASPSPISGAAAGGAARQGDRRLVVDQRHGLCARPCARLRRLGEDGRARLGLPHVLPYFKRMETAHEGEDGWRGSDGPVHVSRGARRNPLYAAFIEAGREAGYPGHRRLQRPPAGRLRRDGDDGAQRHPLVGRQSLSAPRLASAATSR
jgi:hypothetical protein